MSDRWAVLLRDVKQARDHHDKTCRYNGVAVEVHFNPNDFKRLAIDENEDICGLIAVSDEKVPVSRLRVYCDAELGGQGEPVKTNAQSNITVPAKRDTEHVLPA